MNRIISRVALAALITSTVAPVAQAGWLSDFFQERHTTMFSGALLAMGIVGGITNPSAHEYRVQKRNNKLAIKHALDTIVERLEQNKDKEMHIDFMDQLANLKESFPVYRPGNPSPSFETRPTITAIHDGKLVWGEKRETGLLPGTCSAVFDHYALSKADIEIIRHACIEFNRGIDKEEQLKKVKDIQARLNKEQIPTEADLQANKKSVYKFSAALAGIGTLGLLTSLYFKYANREPNKSFIKYVALPLAGIMATGKAISCGYKWYKKDAIAKLAADKATAKRKTEELKNLQIELGD